MTADSFARQYTELEGSSYRELVEIIESAMEHAAETAVTEFRTCSQVRSRLEEVTSEFESTLDKKFGTTSEIVQYFVDLHRKSGNLPIL